MNATLRLALISVLAVAGFCTQSLAADSTGNSLALESITLNDESQLLFVEDDGVYYFFDEDTLFTDIIAVDVEGALYWGLVTGERIEFFDTSFASVSQQDWSDEIEQEGQSDLLDLLLEDASDHDLLEPYNSLFGNSATPKTTAADPRHDIVDDFLGRLSSNRYDPQSISNPYGVHGSQYSPKSVQNPYGVYGSAYSAQGVANPYATRAPKIYSSDGEFLGRLSTNPYDYESVSNPYGPYGSPYSPTSINNPYGQFGSPYSPTSVNNPYATDPPIIIGDDE